MSSETGETRIPVLKQQVDLDGATILVTGAAGFIGAALVRRLLGDTRESTIIGLDNLCDYYDVALKEARLAQLEEAARGASSGWSFTRGDIADKALVDALFEEHRPTVVVNLAAQAGVRYSIDHPDVYIQSNVIGFQNILEACRAWPVEHLVFASSSSVYGGNTKVPFATDDKTDTPVSLYAATKKSNELCSHAYSKLFEIPATGLRFFTVYGPWGRPDMFLYSATEKLRDGGTVQLYNHGECLRDFTYIDDIVEGVVRVMQGAPVKQTGDDGLPIPPYALYNIGGGHPEKVLEVIDVLQNELVRAGVLPADYPFESHRELVPMQPGDVEITYADTAALAQDYGFTPETGIHEGIHRFVAWFAEYHGAR